MDRATRALLRSSSGFNCRLAGWASPAAALRGSGPYHTAVVRRLYGRWYSVPSDGSLRSGGSLAAHQHPEPTAAGSRNRLRDR